MSLSSVSEAKSQSSSIQCFGLVGDDWPIALTRRNNKEPKVFRFPAYKAAAILGKRDMLYRKTWICGLVV